jgi:hypothetical protein
MPNGLRKVSCSVPWTEAILETAASVVVVVYRKRSHGATRSAVVSGELLGGSDSIVNSAAGSILEECADTTGAEISVDASN